MALGEFASPMAHGLALKDWLLLERTSIIALASAKPVNFFCRSSLLLVVGEKVTFHVRTRYSLLISICFLDFQTSHTYSNLDFEENKV